MNIHTSSKSSLFLMELLISIFFFSLTSAACIQIYAKAHILEQKTTTENQGVLWAQNIAEIYLGNNCKLEELCKIFRITPKNEKECTIYFNEHWLIIPSNSSVKSYSAHITTKESQKITTITISIKDSSNYEIYSLTALKHIPLNIY